MKSKIKDKKKKKKPAGKHAARKAAQNALRRIEAANLKKSVGKSITSPEAGEKSGRFIRQNEGKRTLKRSSGVTSRFTKKVKSIFDFRRDEDSSGYEKESLGARLKRKFEGKDEKTSVTEFRRFERKKANKFTENRTEKKIEFSSKNRTFGRRTIKTYNAKRTEAANLPEVSPARKAAFEILERIEKEKAFSSALLPIYEENLKAEDRALCHELTLGVLRNRLFLDEIIKQKVDKRFEKLDFAAVLALRLALYQIYFLDRVPLYAAVDESVNLVRLAKLDIASGFVNAVLRQILRDREKARKEAARAGNVATEIVETQVFPDKAEKVIGEEIKVIKSKEAEEKTPEIKEISSFDDYTEESADNEKTNENLKKLAQKSVRTVKIVKKVSRTKEVQKIGAVKTDSLDQIAIETSHPHWLLRKWRETFGAEEMAKIARANNRIPKISFRLANPDDAETLQTLRDLGTDFAPSEFIEGSFIAPKADDYLLDFAREGKIYMQEEASQLVGKIVNLQADESFWDVCAAPGGKLTQIVSQRVQSPKSKVQSLESGKIRNPLVAGDLHAHRVRFLRDTANLLGAEKVKIFAYDAEKVLPFADSVFDCVLLDAPCSGTGTIRHNPEIRWHLTPEELEDLPAKQLKILRNAAKTVKRKGRLIYSTCSLETEENEDVIAEFLRRNSNFENATTEFCKEFLTDKNFVRTFPHRHNVDGFFVAVLRRFK